MLMAVIAAFGWAFMAAQYAMSEEGWRDNAVEELQERGARRFTYSSWADFLVNAPHRRQ